MQQSADVSKCLGWIVVYRMCSTSTVAVLRAGTGTGCEMWSL